MKVMNVCLLNDSFPPLIDGVSTTVLNYATVIQQGLGSATVVTPKYPKIKDDYPFSVVRYMSINSQKLVGYRAGYPFSPVVVSKLEKEKFDIIHSQCPFASTFLARSLRDAANAPLILTYHTKFDIDIRKALPTEALQRTAIKMIVNNIEACDEVWVVSNGAGENLKSLGYKGDVRLMVNGVDFPQGRVSPERIEALRDKHKIPPETTVFLFVGRLMWYKGAKAILDGLKLVKSTGEKFRMIFVGDGVDREEIEKYASDIGLKELCIFTGAVRDRELLRDYFCLADLFLFPSTFDTNGIVVREAAACALPSMIIKGSCAAEGIEDMDTGVLIEDNAESLAEKAVFACKNKEKMRSVGRNAQNKIYMSWDDSVHAAYSRYETVRENYQRNGAKKTDEPDEKIFEFISDVSDGVSRIHSIGANLRKKLKKR